MAIQDCLHNARIAGDITEQEEAELLRRFAEMERDFKPRAQVKADLERELRAEALAAERRRLLMADAASGIRRDLRIYAREKGPDIVDAVNRLFENFGFTGYSSVRNRTAALIGAAQSEMEEAIHAFRRSGLTMQRRGGALLDEVVRAAFGNSNDPAAQALYHAWLRPAEALREKFNAAGGEIGWRKDWGLPMRHSANAMLAAGLEKWKAYIEPRLDWDKIRHPVTDVTIPVGERSDVLEHVWHTVVMDGWNKREPSPTPKGAARWAQRSDSRFLVFKDADAWREYNTSYGTGDAWATMSNHIRGMARDVALMERFGPSPGRTIDWLKQVVSQEAAKAKAGEPSLFKPGILPRSIDAKVKGAHATIDSLYDFARGASGIGDGPLAEAGAIFRNLQYGAKLGSAVVTHGVMNPMVQSYARHIHGLSVTGQFMDMARAFTESGTREATRAGLIVQDALHVLEQGARESASGSRLRQLSGWLPAATSHYSGLEGFVAAQRRAFNFGVMAHMADQVGKTFEDLPAQTRRLLAGYGIKAADWDVMRQADLHTPQGSAPFLRFREIQNVDHPKAAEAALKYLEMMAGETERAVPSSSWRVRSMLTGGTREGTLAGEMARSFSMFKGFIGSFAMTHLEAVKQEIARDKFHGGAAAGAYLAALTLGGMLVLQLKNIANGKDLRSIDPSTKEGRDTWAHSFMTSGGLGIFGDFLASDHSSYGHGPLETLAGPVVTSGIDAYTGLKAAMDGKKPLAQRVATGLVDFAQNNTPILSTHWALKAAYQRIALDQLRYLADPEAHRKFRQSADRLRKETGQGMFWPRGAVAPERPPGMAH